MIDDNENCAYLHPSNIFQVYKYVIDHHHYTWLLNASINAFPLISALEQINVYVITSAGGEKETRISFFCIIITMFNLLIISHYQTVTLQFLISTHSLAKPLRYLKKISRYFLFDYMELLG